MKINRKAMVRNKRGLSGVSSKLISKIFFYNNEIWLKRGHLFWEHPNATIAWDKLQFIYNTHTYIDLRQKSLTNNWK